jgi:hypothetical protein
MTSAQATLSSPAANRSVSWREVIWDRVVWSRTLKIGVPVGLIQIAINQGDHWLAGAVTATVIFKTILCPTISCSIAFASAASARRETLAAQAAS